MELTETGIEDLGQIERTPRAFWQDAWEAMRRDIVRALVEYITNADDAYTHKGSKGRILVEVEHRRGNEPWKVAVRDRATGMTLNEMKDRIGMQGGRTSGFSEGMAVRGNLGVGSKDPACFGKALFESIKDGQYAWFEIDDQGQRKASAKPFKASPGLREKLGIPANGTVVTLHITQSVPCPRHDSLKQILASHYLLRDIMLDSEREVFLLHANKPGARPERLLYQPPKLAERVDKSGIELPGYPDATVHIWIGEAEEPFPEEGAKSATRKSGLLIKGRRAIYECTLFGFEGNPYALPFAGYVKCEHIDRLANEFDERALRRQPHPDTNPMPIISRRRDGLVQEHPLYLTLKQAAESHLGPLVEDREKKARERSQAVENQRTTRLLTELTKEAARFMQEAAMEEEITIPPSGQGNDPAPALAIIPPAMELPVGLQRTVTIMASRDGLEAGAEVELSPEPPGIVEIQRLRVTLGTNRTRDDILSATTRLTAGQALGVTMLNATVAGRTADCVIEVVPPPPEPPPVAPSGLEFGRPRYNLVLAKPKRLLIRAPLGCYPEGTVMKVTSTNRRIVVLDGGRTAMAMRPERLAMEAEIRIVGRADGEKGLAVATDPRGRTAQAQLDVVEKELGGPHFTIRLEPEVQGDQRAQWSSDFNLLLVMGEHPAVRPYLGDKNEKYPGQDTREFRAILAEIVAEAIVRRILLEKYRDDELDAATFLVHQTKLQARLLARAHRVVASA